MARSHGSLHAALEALNFVLWAFNAFETTGARKTEEKLTARRANAKEPQPHIESAILQNRYATLNTNECFG